MAAPALDALRGADDAWSILLVLFAIQRHGTGKRRRGVRAGHVRVVRRASPLLGVWQIVQQSGRAARRSSPYYAVRFFFVARHGRRSSRSARWCCAITGAEALYADMGHFGKQPIRIAWFGFVLPALVLNYFGQGALLLRRSGRGRESVLPAGAADAAVSR